jgi:molybdate transport system ATP-binding protein
MGLAARVIKRFGAFTLDVDLRVESGQTLVVVGESGAGKSTLLRTIAGLENPDRGRVALGSAVLFDSDGGQDQPAWRRPVGYVPQDYALFPHLDVFENVAFGLRAGGARSHETGERVNATLTRFGLESFAGRRPSQLSGGQQQRVALARALVLEPEVLLLDEPLSALDLRTRQTTRGELRRLLSELTCSTVYVTHQPLEAVVFGDRITVLENGQVTQGGTREDLLRRPRSSYVAAFLGVNLFRGGIVDRENGIARVATEQGEVSVVDPGGDKDVFAVVNPREISLFLAPPEGSARNCFRGNVVELIPEPPDGQRVRVVLGSTPPLVAEITEQAGRQLGLREGMEIYAAFKATGVEVFR